MPKKNNSSTIKKRILQAERAYQKFCAIMENLTRHQRQIVEEAIAQIEKQQIEKLRKRI